MLLFLVLAYVLVLVVVPILSWTRVGKVPFAPQAQPVDGAGANYLIVGTDSREGLTARQQVALGTGHDAGQRTDTIMLLHVPTSLTHPTLVSVPRDSLVAIPGKGRNKINAAFSFGGPKLLTQTVENATGLRVDGYVEIGFGGFVGVVNGLGGVKMCLPKAMQDKKAHIDLQAGCQNLQGEHALGYVRARHVDAQGDLGRVERQRRFMSTVMKETLTDSTVLNPVRLSKVGFAYSHALTVGDTTGVFDLARFSLGMQMVSSGRGTTLTVPVKDAQVRTRVGTAVLWDRPKAAVLFKNLRDGRPIPTDLVPKMARRAAA